MTPAARPVVFLGPSLPRSEAISLLDADYRPPIRRGDLAGLAPGTVVAIIDGVFDQDLAVSPAEIRQALDDGVVVFGGASMGALRAAEVPGMAGVGTVYSWYRDGIITRDDEVALLFNPVTGTAVTVPTVNVRFAVERLARPGTIDQELAARLIEAAAGLHFTSRTYAAIVERAGLQGRADTQDLIGMLAATDLKRADAQAVLETVDRTVHGLVLPAGADRPQPERTTSGRAATNRDPATGQVLIWESGDRVSHDDLLAFLCFTGRLERYAPRALARADLIAARVIPDVAADQPQAFFTAAALRWGWMSTEEARTTLADLGLGLDVVDRQCAGAARLDTAVSAAIRAGAGPVRQAVLAELFLDDLALKREAMRLGSLRWLAATGPDDVAPEELQDAEAVICRANRVLDLRSARTRWSRLGWDSEDEHQAFVRLVARARATARRLHRQWRETAGRATVPDLTDLIEPAPKPTGELRFGTEVTFAAEQARRLGVVIGVTRVGMIGELADLGGIQIAQAARPGGAWSSSYGSGKSATEAGAIAGSVLEEVEKWAQEQFDPAESTLIRASFAQVRDDPRFVDPDTVDLPFDSKYTPELPLQWVEGVDLISGRPAYLPADLVRIRRGVHDICYTDRGSRKHLATNGLGCGFSLAEAALHGSCEYIERHAQRLAELRMTNPGGIGPAPSRFVDFDHCGTGVRELARRLRGPNATVRVLDITGDVAVPTFMAAVVRQRKRADGFGTHPDPEVAVGMALLEAAQTIASAVAGGREDLSIHARSLGRHERPRPTSTDDAWLWTDPDAQISPLPAGAGFRGKDVRDDLVWALERVQEAGLQQVVMADLSTAAILPARVVRIVIPGLETNNPFYTGPRARLGLLTDLLPRPADPGQRRQGTPCFP